MIIVEELHGSLKRQQVFDHSERISESTFAHLPELHDSTRFNTTESYHLLCCCYCCCRPLYHAPSPSTLHHGRYHDIRRSLPTSCPGYHATGVWYVALRLPNPKYHAGRHFYEVRGRPKALEFEGNIFLRIVKYADEEVNQFGTLHGNVAIANGGGLEARINRLV